MFSLPCSVWGWWGSCIAGMSSYFLQVQIDLYISKCYWNSFMAIVSFSHFFIPVYSMNIMMVIISKYIIKSNLPTNWYYRTQLCISEVSLSIFGLCILSKLTLLTFLGFRNICCYEIFKFLVTDLFYCKNVWHDLSDKNVLCDLSVMKYVCIDVNASIPCITNICFK